MELWLDAEIRIRRDDALENARRSRLLTTRREWTKSEGSHSHRRRCPGDKRCTGRAWRAACGTAKPHNGYGRASRRWCRRPPILFRSARGLPRLAAFRRSAANARAKPKSARGSFGYGVEHIGEGSDRSGSIAVAQAQVAQRFFGGNERDQFAREVGALIRDGSARSKAQLAHTGRPFLRAAPTRAAADSPALRRLAGIPAASACASVSRPKCRAASPRNARGAESVVARSISAFVAAETQRRYGVEARSECDVMRVAQRLRYSVVSEHHRRRVPDRNVVLRVACACSGSPPTVSGSLARRAFAGAQCRSVVASFDPVVCGHVREMFGLRGKSRGVETLRAWQRRRPVRREIVEMDAEMIGHGIGRIVVQHVGRVALLPATPRLRELHAARSGRRARAALPLPRAAHFRRATIGECDHRAPIRSVVGRPVCERAVIAQRHDRDESPIAFRQGAARARPPFGLRARQRRIDLRLAECLNRDHRRARFPNRPSRGVDRATQPARRNALRLGRCRHNKGRDRDRMRFVLADRSSKRAENRHGRRRRGKDECK